MGPTASSTYWAACRLSLSIPFDDEEDDVDDAYECLLRGLGADLLTEEHWDLDEGECEAEIVFRVRVANGCDPMASAWARLLAALSRTDATISVDALRCERQGDALARVRGWRECRECGSRHTVKRCLECEECVLRAADDLLAA